MAQERTEFTYHSIKLYKSESLGSGAYGEVCKAKCDGLMCAAKIMHPELFDLLDHGADTYLRKFRGECHLLSLARHPNVVQYLATYYDPDTRLPVLIMELCDESLTAFLERSPRPLSYHIQVKLCHDISLALVYLHSNGLIHRDLSGNNILIIAGSRAKVTDFGMSKLVDVESCKTLCPGNLLYMSPEALDKAKTYTYLLDIFSFGVIVIQLLTRQFPNPTERFRTVNIPHLDDHLRMRQLVPEVERRQTHLDMIPEAHTLKPLALQCLRNEHRRPSALRISKSLSELKRSSEYTESMCQAQCESCIQQHNQRQTTDASSSVCKRHIQTPNLVEELQKVIEDKDRQLQQKEKVTVDHMNTIAVYKRKIQQLEKQVAWGSVEMSKPDSATIADNKLALKDINKMMWREGEIAPEKIAREAAVVHENMAYFRPAYSCEVYSLTYHSSPVQLHWSRFPDNPNRNCGLVVIDGHLTTVEGYTITHTNLLLSLTGEVKKKRWSEIFPPMPTRRSGSTCITIKQALVVAGGSIDLPHVSGFLDTVEVMNINSKQWSTVLPLPKKLDGFSGAVFGDKLYLAGGSTKISHTRSVFACSLHDLLSPTTRESQRQKNRLQNKTGWKEISTLPVTQSTLATFGGHLLAVGGKDHLRDLTSNIYSYNPVTDSWDAITEMKNKRFACFAVNLREQCLIVVGGYPDTTSLNKTDSVEILE